jgi:DNA invertase Pin-like site-specific DNA recombinase
VDAIGYIRVSKVGGREGDSFISPDEQRKAIDRKASREGLNIVQYLEELDASGGDNTRPKWNEALRQIERGKVKALVVWNLSRFSRSTIDGLRAIERVEAAGGSLFSEAGDVGDTTPSGKLTRTIFLGLAQMERERAREGFRAAQRAAIERGVFTASRVPTGYSRNPKTRKLEPNEMAPVIRTMFERRAKGASWVELVNYLTQHGGSNKTTSQTVSNMLRNSSYLGWARNGDFVNKKAHPPIVSSRLFEAVATKQVPRKHTGRAAAESLLGGLVVCDNCGYRMFVTSSGRNTLSYACKHIQCKRRASVRVVDLDAEVVSRIFAYMAMIVSAGEGLPEARPWLERNLSDPLRPEAPASGDLAETQAALADAKFLLAKFNEGKREYLKALTPTEFASELSTLRADVEEAQLAYDYARAEHEVPNDHSFSDFRGTWDEWTHESRKEWLGQFIDRVVLTSAQRKRVPVGQRMSLYPAGRGDPAVLDAHGSLQFVGEREFDPPALD